MIKPEDFWKRVDVSDDMRACWEWQGGVTSGGYGSLHVDRQTVVAHRVAYCLAIAKIPLLTRFRKGGAKTGKKFVLHTCDNRVCCNPRHLFLGSMSDNQLDAYAKKRKIQPKSKHSNAKLTPDQVRKIRIEYATKKTYQYILAKRYKVSQRVISLVVRNETYTDVI